MLVFCTSKCRNRKRNQFSLYYLYERSLLMLLLALHITVISEAFVLQKHAVQTSTPTYIFLSKATHDDLNYEDSKNLRLNDDEDEDRKTENISSLSVITINNDEYAQLMSTIIEDNKTLHGAANDIFYPEHTVNVIATSEPVAAENLEKSIRNSVKNEILTPQNLSSFLTINAIEGIPELSEGYENIRTEDSFLQKYHGMNEITAEILVRTDINTVTENIEYAKNNILLSSEIQTKPIKTEKLDKGKTVSEYVQEAEIQNSSKSEAQSNSDCSETSHSQTSISEKTDDSKLSSSPKASRKPELNRKLMDLKANITVAETNKQKAEQLSSAEFENNVSKVVTTSEKNNLIKPMKSHEFQGQKIDEIHTSEIQRIYTKNKIHNLTDNLITNFKEQGENIKLNIIDINEVLGSEVKERSSIAHREEEDINNTLSTSERSLTEATFETTETFAPISTSDKFYLFENTTMAIPDIEDTSSTFFNTDHEDNFDAMFESTPSSTENDLILYTETEGLWPTIEISPTSDLEDQVPLTTQHPLEAFEMYGVQEFNTDGQIGKAFLSRSSDNDHHFKIRPIMFILLCAMSVLFIVFSIIIYLISFQRQHGTLNIEMQEQRCGKDTFDEEYEKNINLLDVESSIQIPITDESEECLQKTM